MSPAQIRSRRFAMQNGARKVRCRNFKRFGEIPGGGYTPMGASLRFNIFPMLLFLFSRLSFPQSSLCYDDADLTCLHAYFK